MSNESSVKVPPVSVVFEEADKKQIFEELDSVLSSGMVAASEKVDALENFWSDYSGCEQAIACSSGGAGLEVVMRALDVEGKDVLVPTNTFIATVNAVIFAGGRPVFLDLDPESMCVSLEEIKRKRTPNTAGVAVVHIGGIITSDMPDIADWCRQEGLFLVEDAAHAHGSELDGLRAGQFGTAATYSFFATKVMTSGEGGMIVCDDEGLADACRSLRDYGKRSQWETVHTRFGSNYRMSDITAVIGLSQSRRLDEFISYRQDVAEDYTRRLDGVIDQVLPTDRSSWYKYIAMLPEEISQDAVREKMKARNVSLPGGVYDIPVHEQPVFQDGQNAYDLPLAEEYCPRHICLPIFYGISDRQVAHVVESLTEVLESEKSAAKT